FKATVVLFIAFAAMGCGGKKDDKKAVRIGQSANRGGPRGRTVAVSAYVTQSQDLQNTRLGVGTVLPAELAEIRTETPGRIARIAFREGHRVKKGALLVKLDDRELQAQAKRLLARKDQLTANLERKKRQHEIDALSTQELENAQTELAMAVAEYELNQVHIAKTEVRAPLSGQIGLRSVSPGAFVSAGTLLTTLVQNDPAKVEFPVTVEQVPFTKVGDTIQVKWSDQEYVARIEASEGYLQKSNRSMLVRARILGKSELIPGTAVDVLINMGRENVLRIPPDALSGSAEGPIVYLYKNGKAHEQSIAVGARTEKYLHISEGLSDGDTVLCIGGKPVRHGSDISISGYRE
ncbi:MAG: efflux RND transporter periplasmic adaptor subunit, partial [Fibrobacter sp.]|nr:efflux RND transporter periplasmic adaptor subunit [Fibrobacter sp.]